MKIASLIPSGTDIACALGLSHNLVGVSHACDHESACGLPILTQSIVPQNLSPREIDDHVSQALREPDANGSLYRTNRDLLRELTPDIVLTQDICDVCAVNAKSVLCDLPDGAILVNLNATSFDGLWRDLQNVAQAADVDATLLITRLQMRFHHVTQVLETNAHDKKRVLTLEWTDPPFIGGHWVPEIIERAGGVDVLGRANVPSRRATWDEIVATDPDVILHLPCGYSLEETRAQELELRNNIEYSNLRAVENGDVWITNATHLFSRCTPMSVCAVEVVAGILHPTLFAAACVDEATRV